MLKALYESLVDPVERHDREYHARLACRPRGRTSRGSAAEHRVLDPACGYGSFLFHALRLLIAAAREAGWTERHNVDRLLRQVRGLDVHPVAVTLARVTWLLALGPLVRAGWPG